MIDNTTLTDTAGRVFDLSTVYYRDDGSYVLTLCHEIFGNVPFHVPNEGEFAALHAEVSAWRDGNEEHFFMEPEEQAPTPPLDEVKARKLAATILMARIQADMVQTGAFAAAEFATFARAGLFADWAAGQTYAKGYRLAHKGIVYEVMQEVAAIENQPPDAAGMLAVYRPLSVDPETGEEPDGSREHPFAFLYGMDVKNGSYYSYEGKLWLAKADMPACVWTPGTEGLWQWEEAGAI